MTANLTNAPNSSTNPPNAAIKKLPASDKELSDDKLSQQIQSLNEVRLCLASLKKDSEDEAKYPSPLRPDEELLDKMKSFLACPVPIFLRFADSNFNS